MSNLSWSSWLAIIFICTASAAGLFWLAIWLYVWHPDEAMDCLCFLCRRKKVKKVVSGDQSILPMW